MPRVIGVDIPDNKRLEISLTYIFGVGRSLSNKIIEQLGHLQLVLQRFPVLAV